MTKRVPRLVLAGKTQQERQERRRGIRLRDFSVAEKTRLRYLSAVAKVLLILEQCPCFQDYDLWLCDWIEQQWARGEPLCYISDALSGLHFCMPESKGTLRQAWRMFKDWRKLEAPARAPPITAFLVRAIIARAVQRNRLAFATLIALGFHTLLRTGELMGLQFRDIEFTENCGVLSLHSSKSGLRTGSREVVAIRDKLTLDLVQTLTLVARHHPQDHLWPHSAEFFRVTFQRYLTALEADHLALKPYSLRRGGATLLLQWNMPLEAILIRGRWKSISVARLYLEDGLAQLPTLRLSPLVLKKLQCLASQTSPTAFRPL